MKFAFLEFHLTDAMFSNARSVSFLKDTRPVSLYQIAELMKPIFLKLHLTDATFSNARFASLLKDVRPASMCQNVRAASLLQRASSASPTQNVKPVSLSLAFQSYDTRLTFTLRWLRSELSLEVLILRDSRPISSIPLQRI